MKTSELRLIEKWDTYITVAGNPAPAGYELVGCHREGDKIPVLVYTKLVETVLE